MDALARRVGEEAASDLAGKAVNDDRVGRDEDDDDDKSRVGGREDGEEGNEYRGGVRGLARWRVASGDRPRIDDRLFDVYL